MSWCVYLNLNNYNQDDPIDQKRCINDFKRALSRVTELNKAEELEKERKDKNDDRDRV